MKNSGKNLTDLWDIIKKPNICIMGVSELEERKGQKSFQKHWIDTKQGSNRGNKG